MNVSRVLENKFASLQTLTHFILPTYVPSGVNDGDDSVAIDTSGMTGFYLNVESACPTCLHAMITL